MNGFDILLDEMLSQHEQLEAAVNRDFKTPGFDLKPFIAEQGPIRTVSGFRKSQETITLASKLPNKLEPLYRAALNELTQRGLPAFEPRLTELVREHESFIEAAVNAVNNHAAYIDPAASKRHWDRIRECQRIAAVNIQTANQGRIGEIDLAPANQSTSSGWLSAKELAITNNRDYNKLRHKLEVFVANNDDGYREVTIRHKNEPKRLFDVSHGGVMSIVNSVPLVSANGQRNGNGKKSSRKSLGKHR